MSSREEHFQDFLDMRGVENPCSACGGVGVRAYGCTSTWSGGIGGQSVTNGICDRCWGSGDADKPWTDLRKHQQLLKSCFQLLRRTIIPATQPAGWEKLSADIEALLKHNNEWK